MEITEEQRNRWQENKEAWANEAKTNIHTPEDLKKFADKLIKHCSKLGGADCYEETANATTALAHAAVEMCAYQFGLTGFQVGCIMWGIIDKLIIEEHDCGLRMLNYNNMIYPQYENNFEKTIDNETWEALQAKARKRYEENEKELEKLANGDEYAFPAHPEVAAHWKSIVDGKVPFGYKVANY
jgi:hypothetical protein